jgi:starvation-inducible outer membrane lipoprotein
MKTVLIAAALLILAGCVSIPADKEGRTAYYTRVCQGETANQQGVVVSQFVKQSSDEYLMHECLYKHGVR